MKTKDIIAALQNADPSGESEVVIDGLAVNVIQASHADKFRFISIIDIPNNKITLTDSVPIVNISTIVDEVAVRQMNSPSIIVDCVSNTDYASQRGLELSSLKPSISQDKVSKPKKLSRFLRDDATSIAFSWSEMVSTTTNR